MPKRNVRPSPCKNPPDAMKRQELNAQAVNGSMYSNPRRTMASLAPNHFVIGLRIGNKIAQTSPPQINEVRIRSAIIWPASSDFPLPYKNEI